MQILGGLALLSVPVSLYALGTRIELTIALLSTFIALATAISVMGMTLLIIVIPNEIRGLCMSLAMASCVLIGNGLAPLMVSALSGAMGGPSTVGSALSLVCAAGSVVGAITFMWGSRFHRRTPAT
jgi:hypothetical protein